LRQGIVLRSHEPLKPFHYRLPQRPRQLTGTVALAIAVGSGIFDRPDRSSAATDYIARRISARVDGTDDEMAGAGNRPPDMV
jgi:hypothetical protein